MEVAGLILGVIPILIEGLEIYKKGIRSIRTGFQKRKEVEKLCRVLRQQERVLGELLKSILLQSGCDVPSDFLANKREIFDGTETRATVLDYLGENYDTFVDTIQDCEEVFQQLIYKITKLVPSIKGSSDLSRITEANKGTKSSQPDLVARFSLILNKKDFEEECRQLDASLLSLHRLLDLISSNHQLAGEQLSGKAKRLARALWKIRNHTEDLYSAVSKSWVSNCHRKHKAMLFLEDRVEQSRHSLNKRHDFPTQVFHFVFTGSVPQGNDSWHESIVQIFDYTEETVSEPQPSSNIGIVKPRVTINVPPTNNSIRMQDIKDICSAIEGGKANQEHVTFALTKECKIATDCNRKHGFTTFQAKDAVQLKEIFSSSPQTSGRPFTISWVAKISLALNVASSFLQLLRTPWTAPRLSTETVTLLQTSDQNPDFSKPLLSVSFESPSTEQPAQDTDFEVKVALIELGIMLLEVWHEQTLEERFGLGTEPLRPFVRRGHAFEWLESIPGTLPNSYHSAVLHCLAGAMNTTPFPKGWDDMRLWESMCESVIEPLSKLAKS